jgi:2-methylfumaryl-CoA isomerase
MNGILAGLRVIEASAFVAAPLGGMTLAQLGADVIRIDLPGGGLDRRRWPVTSGDVSLFWCGLNKGKRSVCIDFTQPQGRALVMQLVTAPGPDGGLLLTNSPPRGGCTPAALRAHRDDLIQLTIQGKRTGDAAVDYTVNPGVGLPYLTGPVGHGEPVNHVLPAWDLITGQLAATGLLAAERYRTRTGKGQHIKLALEDVALATMGHLGFLAEAELGTERERVGNYLYGAFGADFLCADGRRVMVVALTGKQWSALCEALELRDAIGTLERELRLDLAQEGHRYRARERIAALVAPRILRRSSAAIAELFDRCGVCYSEYRSVSELLADDPGCSVQNPLFARVEQPGVGKLLTPASPLDFSGGGRLEPLAAPSLGEHTEAVLADVLGLDAAAVERLLETGVAGARAEVPRQ